jgi:uncharacterized protein (DUF302 family)
MDYTSHRTVPGPFDHVVTRVVEALKAEGFGVLSDIDVRATLKAKLGEDVPPYRILGACNPPLAHRALAVEPRVGVMLPCNVVVHEVGGGAVEVAAINPAAAMQAIGNPHLDGIAAEVGARLARVVASL